MTIPIDKTKRIEELRTRLREVMKAHNEARELANNFALELRAIDAEMKVLSPVTDLWGGAGPDCRPKLPCAA